MASATITLNRPERKNPLTFESYAELRDLFGGCDYADDVQAVVLTGAGGNFCSGGDVHEIIGPLVQAEGARAADVHPHDGRPRQGDARLPAADRRRDRRRLRRRRRDHGDGLRPAPGHARAQDRLPVQPGRPRRLRHGRLRDAAAHHRPGPRQRTALHRPRTGRRGGRALGLLQPAVAPRGAARPRPGAGRASSPRARPSPTASPRPCCIRNGPWASSRRSKPRPRRRRSAC